MTVDQQTNLEFTLPTKRAMCSRCLRASRACICSCIRTVESQTEVLILQHPAEVQHVKGSARLLHLCLPQSVMVVGEVFEQPTLQQYLNANAKTNILLYPEVASPVVVSRSQSEQKLRNAIIQPINQPISQSISSLRSDGMGLRLVLIDASWRHSKQMLLNNAMLQQLPRYALREMPASRYQIRHAHAEDQLSTLEACTYALMQAEPQNQDLGLLLDAFDAFNALQIQFGVNNLLRTKNSADFT